MGSKGDTSLTRRGTKNGYFLCPILSFLKNECVRIHKMVLDDFKMDT